MIYFDKIFNKCPWSRDLYLGKYNADRNEVLAIKEDEEKDTTKSFLQKNW